MCLNVWLSVLACTYVRECECVCVCLSREEANHRKRFSRRDYRRSHQGHAKYTWRPLHIWRRREERSPRWVGPGSLGKPPFSLRSSFIQSLSAFFGRIDCSKDQASTSLQAWKGSYFHNIRWDRKRRSPTMSPWQSASQEITNAISRVPLVSGIVSLDSKDGRQQTTINNIALSNILYLAIKTPRHYQQTHRKWSHGAWSPRASLPKATVTNNR